ncbi:MAG: phosphohistidine phosphatase SixA [Acidiferrobacterales bacterium]
MMRLILIRHAPAEERTGTRRDCERRLTVQGRRRMHMAARGLKALVPDVSLVAASPMVRARQTAEIVARQYDAAEVISLPALSPGSNPRAMLAWLKQQSPAATVVAVGHEPDLGVMASRLLAKRGKSFLLFKKGAACLIEVAGEPVTGAGRLVWLLTPAVLRQIGS